MPRNRTARLPVVGSPVQSAAPVAYPSRSGKALKRRLVVGGLVLLSLALVTAYFREPAGGGLHELQGAGSSALRPVEVAVERVARPFRDAYGYVTGLVEAKSENEELRAEVARLREQVSQSGNDLQVALSDRLKNLQTMWDNVDAEITTIEAKTEQLVQQAQASRRPLVGTIQATSPIGAPAGAPDASGGRYRGDPYGGLR